MTSRALLSNPNSDYELFTILAQQDDISALQVKNRDGEWIHADPIPVCRFPLCTDNKGTFVINIADCMARWTNDAFQSTIHRAINRSGVERYSVPMFFGADYSVVIDVGLSFVIYITDNNRPFQVVSVQIVLRSIRPWWLESG
jgi:isopenicillin N synthase-like dioxygenase